MSDVYCFGLIASGVLHRIKGNFPSPDGYAEIIESFENHTGEATGAALVLARLGVSVTLDGNWIGDNAACRRTLEFLHSRGIDCSGLIVKPGYQGAFEFAFSNGETRTVFGRYTDLLFTHPQWEAPRFDRLRAAKVVCVDPAFGEATLEVARAANAAGLPLVTCDARADSLLAALADVIAVSGEMRAREYPETVGDEAARARVFDDYLERCRGLVVFTAGGRPIWYGRGKGQPSAPGRAATGARHELPSFKVEVVDSAGAGDSFRGGLIFGLLQDWPDEDTVRFASAVSAMVCTRTPGCVNPPSRDELRAFLAERGATVPEHSDT